MKLFLDTNVVVDFVVCREPFAASAIQIFQLAENNDHQLYISDLSFVNVAYVIRKGLSNDLLYKTLGKLRSYLHVANVGSQAIDAALQLKSKDFEDAVQYYSAKQIAADCIITRNKKDFSFSDIPVWTPEEFLLYLQD